MPDTWYSSSVDDKFYSTGGDVNAGQTIAQWAAQLTGARVQGFSVGIGGSASAGYHAFADNVTYLATANSTTYNFKSAAVGAVPEPASRAMMLVGVGTVEAAARRRRMVSKTALA